MLNASEIVLIKILARLGAKIKECVKAPELVSRYKRNVTYQTYPIDVSYVSFSITPNNSHEV